MADFKKSVILHGIFASEAIDKAGEKLSIKNLDISPLQTGKAVANFEHNSSSPENILGRIVDARKVYSEESCRSELEKRMFKEGGSLPAVFGTVELFEDHSQAEALSKMALHYKKRNLPMPIGFSIEGATLDRTGNDLSRAVARSVALTLKPCNAAAQSELISELNKSQADFIDRLEKGQNRSTHIIGYSTVAPEVIPSLEITNLMKDLSKLESVLKALTAGFTAGPVGGRTQGDALAVSAQQKVKKAHTVTIPDETTDETHEETSTVIHKPASKDGMKEFPQAKFKELKEDAKELTLKLKKARITTLSVFKSKR